MLGTQPLVHKKTNLFNYQLLHMKTTSVIFRVASQCRYKFQGVSLIMLDRLSKKMA